METRTDIPGGEAADPRPAPLFELEDLEFAYGGRKVLSLRHLAFPQGSVVGLVGPNGSGKSTLLKVLALLAPPTRGRLLYRGQPIAGRENLLRREVTLLLQEPFLLKRTVFENVAYGLRARGQTEGLKERVEESLALVGLSPKRFASRHWYQLSGGEAQRVSLASRLALRPRALLLDEPTASVDESSALLIKEAVLAATSEWGTTLVVATHDLVWLHEVATDVVSLYRGRVAGHGAENLLQGNWTEHPEGGLQRRLADGQVVRALGPEGSEELPSVGILSPTDVTLATERPSHISAQNLLRGTVVHMALENGSGRVLVSVNVGGLALKARITPESVLALGLHPGVEVWALFKATALRWL